MDMAFRRYRGRVDSIFERSTQWSRRAWNFTPSYEAMDGVMGPVLCPDNCKTLTAPNNSPRVKTVPSGTIKARGRKCGILAISGRRTLGISPARVCCTVVKEVGYADIRRRSRRAAACAEHGGKGLGRLREGGEDGKASRTLGMDT
eukprot:747082-Hanusia_phi.AAC.1